MPFYGLSIFIIIILFQLTTSCGTGPRRFKFAVSGRQVVWLGLEDLPGLYARPGQPVVLVVAEGRDPGEVGPRANLVDDRVDLGLGELLVKVGHAAAGVDPLLRDLEGGVEACGDDPAGVAALRRERNMNNSSVAQALVLIARDHGFKPQ